MDLATTYSRGTYRPTTIGAAAFHFRVRNGTGWFHHALVTRGRSCCAMALRHRTSKPVLWGLRGEAAWLGPPARSLASTWRYSLIWQCRAIAFCLHGLFLLTSDSKNRNQAERMISTSRLHVLPRFHLKPINVVVFDDPSGKIHLGRSLALRCFQRLSLPHLATRPCP